MTKTQVLIAANLLELASQVFNNHSCNDFIIENTPENFKFAVELTKYCLSSDIQVFVSNDKKEICLSDAWAMRFCSQLLEDYAKTLKKDIL